MNDERRTRKTRSKIILSRLAHMAPIAFGAFATIMMVEIIFGYAPPFLIALPLVICGVCCVMASAWHDLVRCFLCIEMTPLNTRGAIIRYDRQLKFYHRSLVIDAIIFLVFIALVIGSDSGTVLRRVALCGVLIASAIQGYVGLTHRVLYPWCPYCRRGRGGGGGHDEDEPMPLPPTPPAAKIPA